MLQYCNNNYLFPAERDGVFKQAPDDSFRTVRCGEGAIIAIVLGHILLVRNEHFQGHTPQSRAVSWFYEILTTQ